MYVLQMTETMLLIAFKEKKILNSGGKVAVGRNAAAKMF